MAAYSTQSHHLLGRPPTPLQAFRLPTLHCGVAWSLYAHKQRNQTIDSVGSAQSRVRGDRSQALCRCISHCVPSTPLPPPWGLISILARQRSIIELISCLKRHQKPKSIKLIVYAGLSLSYCIMYAHQKDCL